MEAARSSETQVYSHHTTRRNNPCEEFLLKISGGYLLATGSALSFFGFVHSPDRFVISSLRQFSKISLVKLVGVVMEVEDKKYVE
jgi:hypothetical protein